VGKKKLVTGTKVVQSLFSIWGTNKAMFWAFAIAGEANLAFQAVTRKGVPFGKTEFLLLTGVHQGFERGLDDVA
jgi:hypothetical protein